MPSTAVAFTIDVDVLVAPSPGAAMVKLRDWWGGDGTRYVLAAVKGLGVGVRSNDKNRVSYAGDVDGADYDDARPVFFDWTVLRDTAGPVLHWQGWRESLPHLSRLNAAWRGAAGDLELLLYLDGLPERPMHLFGRPHGAPDPKVDQSGAVEVETLFRLNDPYLYGAQVDDAGTGPLVVTNAGTAPTERIVITLTGNGGKPLITNAGDDGNAIAWQTVLAASAVRVIDVAARTIVDDNGNDRYDELNPASPYFFLQPGANPLTIEGVGACTVARRPAYL